MVVLLLFLPLSVFIWSSVKQFGEFASSVNEKNIREQVHTYLGEAAHEQALRYDNYFEGVRLVASLMGSEASKVYSEEKYKVDNAKLSYPLRPNPQNGMFQISPDEDIITLYWGNKTLTDNILTEISVLTNLDSLLIKVKEEIPESVATHIITVSGIGRYYSKNLEAKKLVLNLPNPNIFDLRDGAPLTIFTKSSEIKNTAKWTTVYKDDVIDGLMITAAAPILDEKENFKGEVGIDIPLDTVTAEILPVNKTGNRKSINTLFSFIVDGEGRIVSFPKSLQIKFGIDINLSDFKDSSDIIEQSLLNSTFSEVQNLHENILSKQNNITSFGLEGDGYLIASQPMEKMGWHLAIVVREKELLGSIDKTNDALESTLEKILNRFIYLCIAGSVMLLFLSIFIKRRFMSPLKVVAETASKIGSGDLSVRCDLNRYDEIGVLAISINEMVLGLNDADELKKSYSESLEQQILKRTQDLIHKNKKLNNTLEQLKTESEKVNLVTKALQENKEQMRRITELSIAGLFVIQNDVFCYTNAGLSRLTGYSTEELTEKKSILEIVQPDDRQLVTKETEDRLQGIPGHLYSIKILHKDGTMIDVLVEGAPISWSGEAAILGTMIDITQLKTTENKLRDNEVALQNSLEEKEVLLKEVYHRTKNNMLVIISLLNLQKHEISDKRAMQLFTETENRIRTMSLIHEHLYSSKNLVNIDLGEYLSQVAKNLVGSMTIKGSVQLETNCQNVGVPIDQAMPLGLVVNEIVTNSIQHAFEEMTNGVISIELKLGDKGEFHLIIADNGEGIPADENLEDSFGLQIIKSLVEMQLMGSCKIRCDNGTSFHIIIN